MYKWENNVNLYNWGSCKRESKINFGGKGWRGCQWLSLMGDDILTGYFKLSNNSKKRIELQDM